jgi:hypothetical protein
VLNDEGDIVVPVDLRYLDLWLTGLFGDPDMTDNLDGSWDHEFASGDDLELLIASAPRPQRIYHGPPPHRPFRQPL